MKEKKEMPFEIYWFISSLIFQLNDIFIQCRVSPEQLFVLMYIKYAGKDYGTRKLILRDHITQILKVSYRIQDAMVSKIISELVDEGYVEDMRISNNEKSQLFGTAFGRKRALILRSRGFRKIGQFDAKFRRLIKGFTKSSELAYEKIVPVELLDTEEVIKILTAIIKT